MNYRLLKDSIKFLAQAVIGGLAIAFVILIFFPDLVTYLPYKLIQ